MKMLIWIKKGDEIGELCGTASLYCVHQGHITEPLAREKTSHDDNQVNTCAVATTTTPTHCFPKRVTNDNFIKKAVLESVPENIIRSVVCRETVYRFSGGYEQH